MCNTDFLWLTYGSYLKRDCGKSAEYAIEAPFVFKAAPLPMAT